VNDELQLDLTDEDGMLDMVKVVSELDVILGAHGIPGDPIRESLINLLNEAAGRAFMDGMEF
jgi:hypothetical protein